MTRRAKILFVVGARPNFMKVGPLIMHCDRHSAVTEAFESKLVHTGQHYDEKMSQSFLRQFEIENLDYQLTTQGTTHAEQTASIMLGFEKVCEKEKPDYVSVVGDVNSTLACGIVAKKYGTQLLHIEAGLRSFNRQMPEEINRLMVDSVSDFHFTPSKEATAQLIKEGIAPEGISEIGNLMVDTLLSFINKARSQQSSILSKLGLQGKPFALMTLHRPGTVDHKTKFQALLEQIKKTSEAYPIVFPCHPRTRNRIREFELDSFLSSPRLHVIEPIDYLSMVQLMDLAALVLTDSGGIQEETTVLGKPCLTLREETERPITVSMGTNRIAGADGRELNLWVDKLRANQFPKGKVPSLWDGKAAERFWQFMLSLVKKPTLRKSA